MLISIYDVIVTVKVREEKCKLISLIWEAIETNFGDIVPSTDNQQTCPFLLWKTDILLCLFLSCSLSAFSLFSVSCWKRYLTDDVSLAPFPKPPIDNSYLKAAIKVKRRKYLGCKNPNKESFEGQKLLLWEIIWQAPQSVYNLYWILRFGLHCISRTG